MKTVPTLATALTLLFTLTGNASQNVTVSVNGEITAGTCDASVNGDGADATVILPTLLVDDLNAKGIAGKTAFTIALSNCVGTLNTGGVFFDNVSGVNSRGYVNNSGGTARNTDFILYASDGTTQIKPGDSSAQETYQDITSGSATQTFNVAYVTDGKNATPGTVTGKVTYYIDYK
ncbi:fimbrial protein [Klebsiella aerogenes]|uniref:Type 1 fimbrial protein n=1 Tax=Klebsiella aerogenes TaxID=548 RepID=A0AAP9R1M6_KLEAE|nr:fimbrial protein [Klebsiella aerogenes]QMR42822.1 type 1 fimbrial protein [Klebsiella aerogenes]